MKRQWSDRTVLFASIGMSALAIGLAYLHPLFALLAALMCALVSYHAVNLVSRVVFDKDFQPHTREPTGWHASRRWSAWLLLLPCVLLFVNLLFVFGEMADCMHHKNVWKSGWS